MSVSGDWTLLYSWNGSPAYGSSAISFNANGTFGGQFSGQWVQQTEPCSCTTTLVPLFTAAR